MFAPEDKPRGCRPTWKEAFKLGMSQFVGTLPWWVIAVDIFVYWWLIMGKVIQP